MRQVVNPLVRAIAAGISRSSGGGAELPTTIGEAVGGGYYIGDITVGADTYAVIMAGSDGDSGLIKWKTSDSATAGTDSLVDGFSNTSAMTSAGSSPAEAHCTSYAGGGYSDWYLPAKNELNLAWVNISLLGALGLSSAYYWASTQHSASFAYYQNLGSGTSAYSYKSNNAIARPVRRILK